MNRPPTLIEVILGTVIVLGGSIIVLGMISVALFCIVFTYRYIFGG
jgi:hypothetical protein